MFVTDELSINGFACSSSQIQDAVFTLMGCKGVGGGCQVLSCEGRCSGSRTFLFNRIVWGKCVVLADAIPGLILLHNRKRMHFGHVKSSSIAEIHCLSGHCYITCSVVILLVCLYSKAWKKKKKKKEKRKQVSKSRNPAWELILSRGDFSSPDGVSQCICVFKSTFVYHLMLGT